MIARPGAMNPRIPSFETPIRGAAMSASYRRVETTASRSRGRRKSRFAAPANLQGRSQRSDDIVAAMSSGTTSGQSNHRQGGDSTLSSRRQVRERCTGGFDNTVCRSDLISRNDSTAPVSVATETGTRAGRQASRTGTAGRGSGTGGRTGRADAGKRRPLRSGPPLPRPEFAAKTVTLCPYEIFEIPIFYFTLGIIF